VQLQALMEKTARLHPQAAWCSRADSTCIVDFHPHVGDRVLATYEYHKQYNGANGHMMHVVLAVGGGSHKKHSMFAAERLSQKVATDWMNENFILHDPSGNAVKPIRDAPGPTAEELLMYPGCTEAHLGLTKLQWQACALVGSKIKLRPDKLAPFSCASPETISKVAALQARHSAEYENALSAMPGGLDPKPEDTTTKNLPDNREDDNEPAVPEEELLKFDSVDALKAKEKNMVESKCVVKGVTMYRSEDCKRFYFVATREEMVLKAGDMLGGIGGGIIVDSAVDKTKAVPWTLPMEDRTHVQLAREKSKKEDNDEDKSKFWSGTLYACLRDLDAVSTKPIKITSFGTATAISENGKQKYTFSTPQGAENHHALDYSMTASKKDVKISSHFFRPGGRQNHGFRTRLFETNVATGFRSCRSHTQAAQSACNNFCTHCASKGPAREGVLAR
jgi:hypothetical protein